MPRSGLAKICQIQEQLRPCAWGGHVGRS
jgi:hypothetical protein